MKTKPKPFYVLLTIAVAAMACSKTPPAQPVPGPVPVINALAKVEYTGGDYDSLFYNSDLQVAKIKIHSNLVIPFDQIYTFEYDANRKLTRIVDNTGEHYEYVYINGALASVKHYAGSRKTDFRIYDYTNGKLTGIETYHEFGVNSPGYRLTSESELEYYADGNLKTEIVYAYDPNTQVKYKQFSTSYSGYDTKFNTANVLNRFVYFSQLDIQKNNPGKMIHTDEVSGAQTAYDFAYTYNDFSNPLTQKTTASGNGTGNNTVTAKYYYY